MYLCTGLRHISMYVYLVNTYACATRRMKRPESAAARRVAHAGSSLLAAGFRAA